MNIERSNRNQHGEAYSVCLKQNFGSLVFHIVLCGLLGNDANTGVGAGFLLWKNAAWLTASFGTGR